MLTENGVEDYDPLARDVPTWSVADFKAKVGQEIGVSEWFEITQLSPKVKGAVMGFNYGLDRVRFINQVAVGSKVRGRYTLADAQEKDGALVTAYDVVVEIEGQEVAGGGKPALVATSRGYAKLGDDA